MAQGKRAASGGLPEIYRVLNQMGSLVRSLLLMGPEILKQDRADWLKSLRGIQDNFEQLEQTIRRSIYENMSLGTNPAKDIPRFMNALKISGDLTRVAEIGGEFCAHCAELAEFSRRDLISRELALIGDTVAGMILGFVEVSVSADSKRAREIILLDDEVDRMTEEFRDGIQDAMEENRLSASEFACAILIASQMESIADMVVNRCEEIIYSDKPGTVEANGHQLQF
jgi:phosphate uptake regulator